jgi:hypothetical protein
MEKKISPGFLGRLKFYVAGLAIGCVLMGLFQLAKQKEAREKAAAEEPAPPGASQGLDIPAVA